MKLIVGLGNPGPQYEVTRHNVGFLALDLISDSLGWGSIKSRYGPNLIVTGRYRGEKLVLAKPQLYMNRSGIAVAGLAAEFGCSPEEIIILHDDVDLDLGRLRIRTQGGDGGHKGIRSIIQELGTVNFPRVRIGIGKPPTEMGTPDYVLSLFEDEELEILNKVLPVVKDAVLTLVSLGAETAMNRFNRINLAPKADPGKCDQGQRESE
jgi:PTH1 family peptidyl-tRNA hydrolase